MKLIVGLGNPGKEYNNTRHNIGFMILDNYARVRNFNFDKEKFDGKYAEVLFNNEKIMFLKPQKYMNLSGEVISAFAKYYKIDNKDILIISDDLDMECGKIRLREHGSSGGHNGLKNIENHLGTQEYKRLKIGVGNNKNVDTKKYVLSKFTKEEAKKIDSSIELSQKIIDDFLTNDFLSLMNIYN